MLNIIKSITYTITLISLTKCTSLKTNNKLEDIARGTNTSLLSKIIFLNYNISVNSDKTITAGLIKKILSEGNLKKNTEKKTDYNNGFTIYQLDKKSLAIDSLKIPNPLIKNIEYSDSLGLLSKKEVKLNSADFFIRMQLNPHTKFISLKKSGNINSYLLTTKL